MFETILYEVRKSAAWITLNRPDKLNSFNAQMHAELLSAFEKGDQDDDVRAIVITGAGRAFSAGQDLGEADAAFDYGELLTNRYNPIILKMAASQKPIVAVVNGTAAGAGFSLALAADFRLVSKKASFLNAFVHIGLVPDSGNTYYLPRMIGHAKALELMMLGEKISAEQADQLGLVTRMIPADGWDHEVSEFLDKIVSMPTKAIAMMKSNVQKSWNSTLEEVLDLEAEAQRLAGRSKDHLEGVRAFVEKRKPAFQGK
ncbi:enoyl-CoA hydratase-related protein [Siminovitchia sp. FSL H7-0308]|uniref:2-(1,2-epoxy-1,2-dihydrophenyl)acetyl-CoA isomerase n=1 Tax=Siminovitchia thermophila TaxID=1245522 RepID=A0ABS2R7M1_9BACI|nr:enoyl-CoA hydratase-related protein [Siminovitchia thermophila]MBM7715134.1 2-(1,2-epoxy-1,2-dihydrophenyl)acetyl-CoA isomerase [Siminovitchia thermophila]ONK22792.1 2-(1,2-epoxy-1,2-dihydrophenyl)acetyl-CoA isomerase [Bacillus sp. VT-16-64]